MHRIDLPAWAVERGRRMNRFDAIDPRRTALIAIDMQNAFTRPGAVFANPHACDIIPAINRLASALRAAGGHVVWTRQTIAPAGPSRHPAWHYDDADPFVARAMAALTAGAEEHALHPAIEVAADDLALDKYRYSAFIQGASEIEARLRARGVEMLIVAGTLTNVCCDSSARDAYMLGYRVLFAADATAAITDEEHNAALLTTCLNFADVRTTEALLGMIAAGAAR